MPSKKDVQTGATQPLSAEERIAALTEQLNGLQAQVVALKDVPRHGVIRTKREKIHNCTLREYANEEGEVLGLVTRLYEWKEQKDPTEAKRFIGLCKLDVLDPRTGKTQTVTGVNGIEFLNNAKAVQCKVIERQKNERPYVDPRPGVGVGFKVNPLTGNVIPGSEVEFTVTYTDETFKLEVQSGEYQGMNVEVAVVNQGDSPINI